MKACKIMHDNNIGILPVIIGFVMRRNIVYNSKFYPKQEIR